MGGRFVSHKAADYFCLVSSQVSWCNHIIPTMSNCAQAKRRNLRYGRSQAYNVGNMRALLGATLSMGVMVFGSLSASSNYLLQTYSIGPGASNSASSANYSVETSTGEVVGQTTSSANYSTKPGFIQSQQANVPPAPALSNGGGTYYNKLGIVVNTGGNPSDTKFALAVSADNFTTTTYVQIDGSLGVTPFFQTYPQWGGASGTTIVGLSPATTYEVKASAMQGSFTNTAYGPFASLATVGSSLSFSLSQNTLSMSSLLPGLVITSPTLGTTLATNANFGAVVYASDSNSGLKSPLHSYTIASVSNVLGSLAEGYGLQVGSVSQTSGGPLAAINPYNVGGTSVGSLSSTPHALFSSFAPLTGGTANLALLGKSSITDPSSGDYGDTVTFIAAASY